MNVCLQKVVNSFMMPVAALSVVALDAKPLEPRRCDINTYYRIMSARVIPFPLVISTWLAITHDLCPPSETSCASRQRARYRSDNRDNR